VHRTGADHNPPIAPVHLGFTQGRYPRDPASQLKQARADKPLADNAKPTAAEKKPPMVFHDWASI
jgi:hypothetical protein